MPVSEWDRYRKLVFVRNPFDWVVSQWFHNFQVRVKDDVTGWRRPYVHARYHLYSRVQKVEGESLRSLASRDKLSSADIVLLDNYLKRYFRTLPQNTSKFQSVYLLDEDGKPLVDFIGRFENLQDDYLRLQELLNLKLTLPHVNATSHRDYRTYFTDESADTVRKIWKSDFKSLGYPLDL